MVQKRMCDDQKNINNDRWTNNKFPSESILYKNIIEKNFETWKPPQHHTACNITRNNGKNKES